MIDKLLQLTGAHALMPIALIAGLVWLAKHLFSWHQWRSQNRKEFLVSWQCGDQQDDIWLEVVIRHLTGAYLPAAVIRGIDRVPGKVEALLELAQIWTYLKIDPATSKVTWRSPAHIEHNSRKWRSRAWTGSYFLASMVGAMLGLLATKMDPTGGAVWVLWVAAVTSLLVALRCLNLSDELKTADTLAPRWLTFFNAPDHELNMTISRSCSTLTQSPAHSPTA